MPATSKCNLPIPKPASASSPAELPVDLFDGNSRIHREHRSHSARTQGHQLTAAPSPSSSNETQKTPPAPSGVLNPSMETPEEIQEPSRFSLPPHHKCSKNVKYESVPDCRVLDQTAPYVLLPRESRGF